MITLPSRLRMGVPATGGGPATYVGATSDTNKNGLATTSITGTQSGDTYIIAFENDNPFASSTPMVPPLGWSGMNPNWPNENRSVSVSLAVAYGTTAGTVQTTGGRVCDALSMVAFRDLGTPPSTYTTSVSDSFASSLTLPSMTVTEAGSTALIIAFIDDDASTVTSVPSGYTLAVEDGSAGGSVAIMYQLDMPVGATGTAAVGWSSSDALVTVGYIIPPPA